jgi:hypothetical protein
MTRETAAKETPAALATSEIVGERRLLLMPGQPFQNGIRHDEHAHDRALRKIDRSNNQHGPRLLFQGLTNTKER